jgi:hypothetical protein
MTSRDQDSPTRRCTQLRRRLPRLRSERRELRSVYRMKSRPRQRWRVTHIVEPRRSHHGIRIDLVQAGNHQLSGGSHSLHVRPPRRQRGQSLLRDRPRTQHVSSATAPVYEQRRRRATKRTSQPHLTEPERPALWWLPSAGAPVRHHGPSHALSLPCRLTRAQPTTCENFLHCYQERVVNRLFGHCAIPQPWRGSRTRSVGRELRP